MAVRVVSASNALCHLRAALVPILMLTISLNRASLEDRRGSTRFTVVSTLFVDGSTGSFCSEAGIIYWILIAGWFLEFHLISRRMEDYLLVETLFV